MSFQWDNNKWKQGSICLAPVLDGVLPKDVRRQYHEIYIAISHDCDIANRDLDKEPFIEFLPAKFMDKENGNYLYGKNPRILNLQIFKNDIPFFVEIETTTRFNVKKENLLLKYPDENYSLVNKDKKILQDWLAARYRRHALPDELIKALKKDGFLKKLTEGYSEQKSRFIQQIRLHYEPDRDIQLDERYELEILFIHDGTEESRISAEETALNLKKASGKIQLFDLNNCVARATSEVTMDDLGYYDKLNLDYISHKYDYSDDTQGY